MKTIKEIVREMRRVASLRAYADLIEEAHKRELAEAVAAKCEVCDQVAVAKSATTTATCKDSLQVGNAAKMRKALQRASDWFNGSGLSEDDLIEFDEVCEHIEKALSAPPRNCDLYASRSDAWVAFRKKNQQAWYEDLHLSFPDWLFAEAKGIKE
jgi:chorismate mutase